MFSSHWWYIQTTVEDPFLCTGPGVISPTLAFCGGDGRKLYWVEAEVWNHTVAHLFQNLTKSFLEAKMKIFIYLFIYLFIFYKWSNNSHFNTKMFHTLIMPFKHRRVTFLCGPASTAPHGENPINCSVIWSQKSKITSVGNFIFTGPGVSSATPPCKCTVHWVCGGEESKLWWVEEEERSKPITLICCWKQLKKL